MPPATAVAAYWAGGHLFPFISADRPECFCCGACHPEWRHLERAHLVDRFLGGLDHSANLVMLCARCHAGMPSFDIDEGADALLWVLRPTALDRVAAR